MKMENNSGCLLIFIIVFFVIFFVIFFVWEKYNYDDCRKVGHSFMYCLMKIGK